MGLGRWGVGVSLIVVGGGLNGFYFEKDLNVKKDLGLV